MSLSLYPVDNSIKRSALPPPRLQGDGDPDCPKCRGRGSVQRVYTPEQLRALPPYEIPSTHYEPCPCTRARREREALERVWRGLSAVEPAYASRLTDLATRSLWIRGRDADLVLRHVALVLRRTRVPGGVRVVSDADLLDAETADWGERGNEEDERGRRDRDDGLKAVDLYSSPGLLILLVGQTSKKHKYLAELCEDACRRRKGWSKATWVVDQVRRPLAPGHRTHSEELADLIADWTKVLIEDERDPGQVGTAFPHVAQPAAPAQPATLSKPAAPVQPDKLDGALTAAGLPAGLPRHPAGGAAVGCDVCGGTVSKSVFLGARGDLLEKCHNEQCPTGGKVTPLLKRPKAAAKVQAKVEGDDETAGQGGPQVEAASRWLREQLAHGPRPIALVEALAKDDGISVRTLYRARQALGAVATGPAGAKMLALPQTASPSSLPAASAPLPAAAISDDEIDAAIDGM